MPKKLLTVLILLFAANAFAQDTLVSPADSLERVYLEREMKQDTTKIISWPVISLEPLFISKYHINENVIEEPAAISVLRASQLERNNFSDISPLLNTLPGVFMQSGGINTNRISIRGIGARTPYGTNKIRAFYGSIPLTSGDSETTIEDIDLQLISKIEVIKGPQSSVYGAGLGGAIIIEPRHGGGMGTRGGASSTFGSFGLQKNTITFETPFKDGNLSLSYHNLNTDGWRDNSAYKREGITLAGNALTSIKGNLTYFGNYTYMKAYIPSSVNFDSYSNNPRAAAPTWAASKGFERYKSWMAGLGYDWHISDNVTSSTSIFASGKNNYEPRPFDILTQNNSAWGARTQLKGKFNLAHKYVNFVTGLEYFNDGFNGGTFQNLYQENNGSGSLEGSRITGSEQQRNFINAFSQLRVEALQHVEVQAGVNYNKTNFDLDNTFPAESTSSQNYSYAGVWSPQVAVMYKPSSLETWYASVSRGFSMPAIEETLTPQGTINPNIKPESGYNFEVGAKRLFTPLDDKHDPSLYAEISIFRMQVNNLLVAQRVGDDQYVGVNAGQTLHQGIEASLNYHYSMGGEWVINPYVAASIGQYEFKEFVNNDVDYSGNNLTGVPNNKINGGFTLAMPHYLTLSADYYYVDQIPLNDANSAYAKSYNLLNAKLTWKWYPFEHTAKRTDLAINLSAGVNNITDTRYASMVLVNATGINGAAPRYYYPGLPVNYYGNISLSYGF